MRDPDRNRGGFSEVLYGAKIFPGIAIGRARIAGQQLPKVEHIYLPEGRVERELGRFKKAVRKAGEQLLQIRDRISDDPNECTAILGSHLHMLQDAVFHDRALTIIKGQEVNAEWALEMSLAQVEKIFCAIEDPFLRERFHDFEQVANRILMVLAGVEGDSPDGGDEQRILVSRDLAPEDILRLDPRKILGLATELGSLTSHAAIVARNMGITSIMGIPSLTDKVATGDLVVLDGYTGRMLINPTEEQQQQARDQLERSRHFNEKLAFFSHLAAETQDGMSVAVTANLEMAEECSAALQYGATGVGLFRSEYAYMVGHRLPMEEELYASYRQLLQTMTPFPVTVRTVDAGGDKLLKGINMPREKNPALGLRAIRLTLMHEDLLRTQLRSLYRAGIHGRLRLLWPMVSNLQELQRIAGICREVMGELRKEGTAFDPDISQGVMIEVPSAVALADVMAKEVDFFSIGTNDLIQYTLAVDRSNAEVAHLYDPFCPSVLRMIKQVVASGHSAGIEVAVCGEMAADLACVPLLLGMGIDELSITPLAAPYVKRLIRASRADELEELARKVLRLSSSAEVQEELCRFLDAAYCEEIDSTVLERLRQGVRGMSAAG
jgi:phosphotransferase system enzyme I (PtsI)